MRPENRYFFVFRMIDVVGGVPAVVCDAPSLSAAVRMVRELEEAMVGEGETPSVDATDVGYVVSVAHSIERAVPGEEQHDTIAVYHADFYEDQILRRRAEDGALCWVYEDGEQLLVM